MNTNYINYKCKEGSWLGLCHEFGIPFGWTSVSGICAALYKYYLYVYPVISCLIIAKCQRGVAV